ncbi:MAG TPA: UBP-type zinc finger domain-containing protein [Thermoleophilaceae bacterium]|nr:UBP-type zinc finger domain-containing protein [Thermoleophilaceae bacterium]
MGLRDNLRFAVQRATGHRSRCPHTAQVRDVEPDSRDGCPECLALGDDWRALRICAVCGHVGCCDSSKNRHATRHAHTSGHPIARSFEPGEDWAWCYVDRRLVDVERRR